MKKVMTGLLSLVMLVMVIACSDDDPVSSDSKNWKVVDALDNPVEGAKIVVSYYREVFDSTGVLDTLNPVNKYTLLPYSFSVVDSSKIDLIVKDYYTKDTVRVLIDGHIYSGGYTLGKWDLKNSDSNYVPNGVYELELTFNDTQSMSNYKMICYDYDGVDESELEFIATTDSDGRFSFNPLEQILDYEGEYVSSSLNGDVRFADYVKLWVVKDDYENACIDSFDLMGANENIEIVLKVEGGIIIEE